jgi:mono/diheme cytochrome c family protein
MVKCRRVAVVSVVTLALTGVLLARGQESRPTMPTLLPESLAGSVSFDLYCAACHGRFGHGDGPVGPALLTRPADLTTLARRNRGTFPKERLSSYIEGTGRDRLIAVHGKPDMPVWGPTLRELDGSDGLVSVRLQNLVAFIESIQAPSQAAAPPRLDSNGATLFKTFCANCHGDGGRGNGALAGQMRHMPADLTKFARRNGGVFPRERVRQILDGTGVASHGDRDMPVWGSLFKMGYGGRAESVEARIDALVMHLEAIQERPAE